MADFIIEANSLGTSYFEGGAKNYAGINAVPSAMMKTTSYEFGRLVNQTEPLGVFDLEITNTVGILNINKLVGFFASTNAKHFLELEIPINLDLSGFGNNSYILAFYPKYHMPDVETGTYPYTELIFEVVASTETPIGVKLADIQINTGDITSITLITLDDYGQKMREWIGADEFVKISGDIIQGNLGVQGTLEVEGDATFGSFTEFDDAIKLGKNTSNGNPQVQFSDISVDGLTLFLDIADRVLKTDRDGTISTIWTSENFDPSDFPTLVHTHNISDVTNLQSELNSKPTGSWSFNGTTLNITL